MIETEQVETGVRYGKLMLTGKSYNDVNSRRFNECICDCGNIVFKRLDGLMLNKTKSCGGRDCKLVLRNLNIKNGDKYNYLTLTGCEEFRGIGRFVETICICGTLSWKRLNCLRRGSIKSCGCMQKQLATKHGHYGHPIYHSYLSAKGRCYNEDNEAYMRYGGRGIGMCEEWYNNFEKFYDWSLVNGWKEGLTLDRFPDNDGWYEPNNCRWATVEEQNKNKRNNRNLTAFGETKCISDWAKDSRCAVSKSTLLRRIRRNMEIEVAIIYNKHNP